MELKNKKCVSCEGSVKPFSSDEINEYLKQVSDWKLVENKIEKEFLLKDFVSALKFVNQVGEVAELEGHHPDIFIYSWNKVRITIWTHAIGGLFENDFILAAKIDAL